MSLARVRALTVIGVLALVAVITVVWAIVTDDQTGKSARGCDTVQASIPAPSAVKVRVYNGTDEQGLADKVGQALKKRGFNVLTVGNDPQGEPVSQTAQIRYGPTGAGAAQLLQASVRGSVIVDDAREDASIDVVLGIEFKDLTPEEDVPAELENLDPVQPTDAAC
ncbi:LytR C-terminal domain-containing protein [Cryptosporangium aurantiacum]|uniref:LytR C-terminal domain-containing protein n=1 Tax=Cryptosporangium aurantiacum TaxID=134849 RepID=UPI0015BDF07C|nr:LytR C-terminal domain-containing protein [Cryptosporangium aurantiacum]